MMRLTTVVLALAALICLLTPPSFAADVSLGYVLMGKAAPLTIKFGDITPQWSQFTLAPGHDQAPNLQWDLNGTKIDQHFYNSYYTKGETISSGGETFLLAYCRSNPVKSMLKEGLQLVFANERFDPIENIINYISVGKDTPLNLCLLNLKDSGNILDIHPADTKEEILITEDTRQLIKDKAMQDESMSRLRQLALAAIMWSNENEECLPTLSSEKDWVNEIQVTGKLLKQPLTGETYHANKALSGLSYGEIPEPVTTPLFYESTPWPSGVRAAVFVDGHVELVGEGRWEEMKAQWNLK